MLGDEDAYHVNLIGRVLLSPVGGVRLLARLAATQEVVEELRYLRRVSRAVVHYTAKTLWGQSWQVVRPASFPLVQAHAGQGAAGTFLGALVFRLARAVTGLVYGLAAGDPVHGLTAVCTVLGQAVLGNWALVARARYRAVSDFVCLPLEYVHSPALGVEDSTVVSYHNNPLTTRAARLAALRADPVGYSVRLGTPGEQTVGLVAGLLLRLWRGVFTWLLSPAPAQLLGLDLDNSFEACILAVPQGFLYAVSCLPVWALWSLVGSLALVGHCFNCDVLSERALLRLGFYAGYLDVSHDNPMLGDEVTYRINLISSVLLSPVGVTDLLVRLAATPETVEELRYLRGVLPAVAYCTAETLWGQLWGVAGPARSPVSPHVVQMYALRGALGQYLISRLYFWVRVFDQSGLSAGNAAEVAPQTPVAALLGRLVSGLLVGGDLIEAANA